MIVKHHELKYGSKMPLWVVVELLSFSNISKLYNSMYLSEKRKIASEAGTGDVMLENHLHCLSVLRNKCAHAARLYNTTFYPPARFSEKFLRKHPEVLKNSLFAYVLVLLHRLPDKPTKIAFFHDVLLVIEEYKHDVDLSKIGFPENFEELLKNAAQ